METDMFSFDYKVNYRVSPVVADVLDIELICLEGLKTCLSLQLGLVEADAFCSHRIDNGSFGNGSNDPGKIGQTLILDTPKRLCKLAAKLVDFSCQQRRTYPSVSFIFYVVSNSSHVWTDTLG